MKKLKKLFRFCFISALVLVVWIYACRYLFRFIWSFDILDKKTYLLMADYWEKGGVFNSYKDYSLGIGLFLIPVLWLVLSYKLYKYGLKKFLTTPIIKIYRYFTRPESMEVEHVLIKNLGGKDKTLDEIISEKIKEQNGAGSQYASRDLRKQIAAKIKENENK